MVNRFYYWNQSAIDKFGAEIFEYDCNNPNSSIYVDANGQILAVGLGLAIPEEMGIIEIPAHPYLDCIMFEDKEDLYNQLSARGLL